ncbi:Jag N-terminal domain-containing protein [Hydrogenimonas sp. SS33]|uniref:Jag N-terminal domain-containing protein n=1 Tax=Hydrogenimonas leucolamina TaxID=2954236 RepID=UPI00336BB521
MQRFEAPTLEEAYAEAARTFSCSVTELDIQVVQNPSRGFLGLGRKNAVIMASAPAQEKKQEKAAGESEEQAKESLPEAESAASQPAEKVEPKEAAFPKTSEPEVKEAETLDETSEEPEEAKEEAESKVQTTLPEIEDDSDLFGNFYSDTPDIHTAILEIERDVNHLFDQACFDIEPVKVAVYDDETVLVEFNGNDAALLIGKEGYRYKALASLLYNWIHGKYGYRVRLEIAEFLKNQETMIENYLQPVIERAEKEGRAQTKVLDGILVQIALQRLREVFPDKYVAVRTNREGGRYVIVNEFMEKR